MEGISEAVEKSWKTAAEELRHINAERRRKGQRRWSERQWRDDEKAKSEKNRKEQIRHKKPEELTYFMQGRLTGLIKIGRSKYTAEFRRDCLQVGSPDILVILKTVLGEKEPEYHKKFAHLRQHGEWFTPAPELLEFIKSL
jgi:hypothetical protein